MNMRTALEILNNDDLIIYKLRDLFECPLPNAFRLLFTENIKSILTEYALTSL